MSRPAKPTTKSTGALSQALEGNLVTQVALGELDGPWDACVWFTLPGQVQSKSNYRQGGNKAWSDVTGYETAVFSHARAARPATWAPLDTSVPAARRPRYVAAIVARTRLDAANLSKSILDSLQGALFVNDAQVLSVTEAAVPTTSNPGALIAVAQMPPGTDLATQLAAQAALVVQVAALFAATPARPTSQEPT